MAFFGVLGLEVARSFFFLKISSTLGMGLTSFPPIAREKCLVKQLPFSFPFHWQGCPTSTHLR